MKFKIVETKKMSGREKLLKYLDQKKKEETAAQKRYEEKEKGRKEKKVKEGFTGSGAGFPSATDASGGQAIDKALPRMSTKKAKRKKKIKRILVRRAQAKSL